MNISYVNLQVIFVDADQIVRADMGELYDMDIKGRPLAYTPFCDNNRDMDGYRFWRQVEPLIHIICSCTSHIVVYNYDMKFFAAGILEGALTRKTLSYKVKVCFNYIF